MIWVFPILSTSIKKNTESSVIFLRNDVLILNGKENKEATAIFFEIRMPKKKNKELLRKVPSKIHGSNFIMENNKTKFWFVNISDYPHREMGLRYLKMIFIFLIWFQITVNFLLHDAQNEPTQCSSLSGFKYLFFHFKSVSFGGKLHIENETKQFITFEIELLGSHYQYCSLSKRFFKIFSFLTYSSRTT